MARQQGVRRCVARRGRRGGRGGARGGIGEAWGGRWPRRQWTAATAALGCARERESRGGGEAFVEERGRARRLWGSRGVAEGVQGDEEGAGRQGGAGLLGRARASTQLLLLAGGRRQGGAPSGLGRQCQARWAAGKPGKAQV